MATSLKFYADAALTTELTELALSHNVDGSGDPQDLNVYLGSINAANQFRNDTDPGIAPLQLAVTNATPLWASTTAYAVNDTARTTAKNGYRYKAQAIAGGGLSGAAEPAWPLVVGATVVDDEVTWINDGKLHESTEIKLATSQAGLDAAVAGAALDLGVSLAGGAAGALPIWLRVDDATAVIGSVAELGVAVADVLETPV